MRSPTRRASATQSAMVAPRTGTKGTTSVAPIRGCSPLWWLRSMRSAAARARTKAASATAAAEPTKVNTARLCEGSASRSSIFTPGTAATAPPSASSTSCRRPSLTLGTHSMISSIGSAVHGGGRKRTLASAGPSPRLARRGGAGAQCRVLRLDPLHDRVPVEALAHGPLGGATKRPAQRRVPERREERGLERRPVAVGDKQPGFAVRDDVSDPPDPRGHHGLPARHHLQQHDAEGLVLRGQDEDIAGAVGFHEFVLAYVAEELYVIAYPERRGAFLPAPEHALVLADGDEIEAREFLDELRHQLDHVLEVLVDGKATGE